MSVLITDFIDLFKKEPIITFLICWLFIGMVSTTLSTYAALILIPILISKPGINKCTDSLLVIICFYSFTYAIFTLLNGFYENAIGNVFFQSLYPPTFYLLGKWLVKARTDYLYILFFLIISLISISVFIDVVNDIRENQFINVLRTIEREDGTKSSAATNLGMRVSLAISSIGVMFSPVLNAKEKNYKIAILTVSLLGIMCAVHLINRTGVVISFVSIFVLLIVNIKKYSIIKLLLIITLSSILFAVYFPTMQLGAKVEEAYSQRSQTETSNAIAGDRGWRWQRGIEDIINYPIGYSGVEERGTYAHNFWLDTSATGGFMSLMFLMIVTFVHLKRSVRLLFYMKNGLLKSIIICCNIGFFLTCFVEPVMEGYMIYIFLFFFFIGMNSQILNKYRTKPIMICKATSLYEKTI